VALPAPYALRGDVPTILDGLVWVPVAQRETRAERRRRRARARRRRFAGGVCIAVALIAVPAATIPLLLAAIRV
jgi:hypothetical protein